MPRSDGTTQTHHYMAIVNDCLARGNRHLAADLLDLAAAELRAEADAALAATIAAKTHHEPRLRDLAEVA